jgi:hypothetical protein
LIAVLAISHVKGIQASFPSSFYGIRLSESTDATNTDKTVPQDNATTDFQTADKAAASQVSETPSAERPDVDELFKDFPFEAPRLPNFPMSPGSVEMAHKFYSDIKKEVMQGEERENTKMPQDAFSFSSRVRTLGTLLSGSLLAECKRILLARTIPTIVLYAIFWIRNHKLSSENLVPVLDENGNTVPVPPHKIPQIFSFKNFSFLLIHSEVAIIRRYFIFELMASVLRPFPFLQYKNGSVNAEPTFKGIDVSNIWFVTFFCLDQAKILEIFIKSMGTDSETLVKYFIIMHFLLSFLGIPVFRHILMIVHIVLPVTLVFYYPSASYFFLLFLPIGVMTSWCQYYNDGFAVYEAPDWTVKAFNKQSLPSVSQTISDVGVDFAFQHFLDQVVSALSLILVATLLYLIVDHIFDTGLNPFSIFYLEFFRFACFLYSDIFKYSVQRSAKFYLFPNLSFFVDANLYFTVRSIPFYVPTLFFLVLSSKFTMMATGSKHEARTNYLDYFYLPIDFLSKFFLFELYKDEKTISRMLATFFVLHLFNSTAAAILYPISFVYLCYFYNIEPKVKDKFYAILSVLSTLPTAYCFYRGKGMIPWTHTLREKANLPVTLSELRTVYHKKILDFAAAKQKFLDRLPASPKSNSGQGDNNEAKKLKKEPQAHETKTLDTAEPSSPSAESSQATKEKSSAYASSILTAVILSIGAI